MIATKIINIMHHSSKRSVGRERGLGGYLGRPSTLLASLRRPSGSHSLSTFFFSLMRLVALQLAFEDAVSGRFTLFQGVLPMFCCFWTFLPSMRSVHSGITMTCPCSWGFKKESKLSLVIKARDAVSWEFLIGGCS